MMQTTTHENGLKLITYQMPHMNSVSMGIWVGAGGRYETPKLSGISHFIEHLVFKGTEKRDGKEISEAIEGVGGVLNAFTGEEYTCYYAKVLGEYFDSTFDVLWDMASNLTFKTQNIEKEKPVIKEEIMMYVDLPAQYVHDLLSEVLWPNQSLGRMLIGTVDTVDSIQNDDLVTYKKQMYSLNNIVIAVAGNINHQAVSDTVRASVDRNMVLHDALIPEAVIENQQEPAVRMMSKDTEQSHIAIGVRAFARSHKDRYVLKVLNTILGENMSSRLFQEVREKHGLVYSIQSAIERFNDTGALVVSAGTDPGTSVKTIELILKVMDGFRKESVSEDELERAKKYVIGQLSLGLEKTMNIMMWLGEGLLTQKKVQSVEEILKQVRQVTREDIMRVGETLFQNNRLNMAIISPLNNKKSLESAFQF